MKNKIIAVSFFTGLLFFCFYQDWILITVPFKRSPQLNSCSEKKSTSLYFFKNNSWHRETDTILWSKNSTKIYSELLNRWFLVAHDEDFLSEKVKVMHCALSQTKTTLFISLNRSPFSTAHSIKEKMVILESILKTIRETELKISYLYILIDNKPLTDQHINFLNPLPINGFMNIQA